MPEHTPPASKSDTPYRLRDRFLSVSEIALLRQLQKMAGDRYIICPKVALTDIFSIVRPNENVHFYNKIFRKHVDFLLCNPKTLMPAIAVELTQPIAKTVTRASDRFMEELFSGEGIPLVRVPLGEHYEVSDLVNLFTIAVMKTKGAARSHGNSNEDFVPMCPICGKMMVLRIHRGGQSAGKKYYGCMDSPSCRGIVTIG